MKPLLLLPVLIAGLASLSSGALAAGEGKAVGVNPDAVARLGAKERILTVGVDVSVGDLIVTGRTGQVQIVFSDQTHLVVGPGSSLRIETYLLGTNNTAQKLAIDALSGSFRFVTGKSPKPAYSINTPTASIAVRGTKFDILVDKNETRTMLYDGALSLCTATGACQEISSRCDIASASPKGPSLQAWGTAEHLGLSRAFPFARFQSGLLGEFKIGGAVQCTEAKPGDRYESISTTEANPTVNSPQPP